MKQVLIVLFCYGLTLCSEGQGVIPCNLFPITNGVCYLRTPPNFSANLDGSHAIPPNDNTLTASASIIVSRSALLVGHPYATNVFFICTHLSDTIADPRVSSIVASIQAESGGIITNRDGPLVLSPGFFPLCPPILCIVIYPTTVVICPSPTDYLGWFVVSDRDIEEMLAGRWYVHVAAFSAASGLLQEYEIRGQILPLDNDSDGIPDYSDRCLGTSPGGVVDAVGCSIEQLAPCEAGWRDHGEFVAHVAAVSERFVKDGLISQQMRQALLLDAAASRCGSRENR